MFRTFVSKNGKFKFNVSIKPGVGRPQFLELLIKKNNEDSYYTYAHVVDDDELEELQVLLASVKEWLDE